MAYPREILNMLKWKEGMSLEEAVIWYVHRGAPGDVAQVSGSRIRALERYFFETDEAAIPYHRVLRIDFRGETIFRKSPREERQERKSSRWD